MRPTKYDKLQNNCAHSQNVVVVVVVVAAVAAKGSAGAAAVATVVRMIRQVYLAILMNSFTSSVISMAFVRRRNRNVAMSTPHPLLPPLQFTIHNPDRYPVCA